MLAYSTWTGKVDDSEHMKRVARIATARQRRVVSCSETVPEPHERGEFPMTCYACHLVADD